LFSSIGRQDRSNRLVRVYQEWFLAPSFPLLRVLYPSPPRGAGLLSHWGSGSWLVVYAHPSSNHFAHFLYMFLWGVKGCASPSPPVRFKSLYMASLSPLPPSRRGRGRGEKGGGCVGHLKLAHLDSSVLCDVRPPPPHCSLGGWPGRG